MAPPKATAWPESIFADPDVLELDVNGKYVLCRVCAESYAMRRGKKPKPVAMNACFRTRAWETHKLRTRAHRLQQITAAPALRNERPMWMSPPSSSSVVSTTSTESFARSPMRVASVHLPPNIERRETPALSSLRHVIQIPHVERRRITPHRREYEAVSPLVFPLSRYPSQVANGTQARARREIGFAEEPRPAVMDLVLRPIDSRWSSAHYAPRPHERESAWESMDREPKQREQARTAKGQWSELRFV